jgi:hypothetical protein
MNHASRMNFPCECNLTMEQDGLIGIQINKIIRTTISLCIPIGLPRLSNNNVSMDFRIGSKRIVKTFSI